MNQEKTGKIIRENRLKLGLTQNQLGDILGVSFKTISRWENGNYMPDISMLIPLSKALNISLNELLDSSKPEEKIVEVARKGLDKKQKKIYYLEIIILIFLLFIIFMMGRKIYIDNYYKNIEYDKDKMECLISDDKILLTFKNYSPFTYYSYKIVDEENEYIFVNIHYDYNNIKNYSENYINKNIYEEEINHSKKTNVYYIKYSLLNNSLDDNIKNSVIINCQ